MLIPRNPSSVVIIRGKMRSFFPADCDAKDSIFNAMGLFREITMSVKLMKFLRDEDGVTAIEYGLIAGLVAVVIIVALTTLGTDLTGLFNRISGKLTNVGS